MKKTILTTILLALSSMSFAANTPYTEAVVTKQSSLQNEGIADKVNALKKLDGIMFLSSEKINLGQVFSYDMNGVFDPDVFRDAMESMRKSGRKVGLNHSSFIKMMELNKKKGRATCSAARQLVEIIHIRESDFLLFDSDEEMINYRTEIDKLMDGEPDLIYVLEEK